MRLYTFSGTYGWAMGSCTGAQGCAKHRLEVNYMCKFRVKNQVGGEDGSSGTWRAEGGLEDPVGDQAKVKASWWLVLQMKNVSRREAFSVFSKMFPPWETFLFSKIFPPWETIFDINPEQSFPQGNIFGKTRNMFPTGKHFGKTKNVSHRETFF